MSDSARRSGASHEATPPLSPLRRAFIALEDTRAQLIAAHAAAREPIAVIGFGCRVPGDGDDAASFWRILRDGVDAISPLPADRWEVDGLYHPDPDHPGTMAMRHGGFLRRVDGFDPTFFGITHREAQGMDPQQRLLLEVCWEALEHAGQAPDRLDRSPTGVYVGVCGSDYSYLQLETGDRTLLDAHFAAGIAHSVASGRLSYLLGLQGPSLTIDTACSSSLVAVHLACQALRAGDCRMALAGGVNLILSPDLYIALSHSRMLSPDGRCKTFDASADGYARGEGSGVVVLKSLRNAEADGDRILAVIRGSAVNQDGASSGLTAPSGPAQEAVVREALSRAGIAPGLVSYVEAHGTGTQLGDPLELRALGAVFAADRPEGRPLAVGSVKTNVGHLEAAAGVIALIKVVLALRHRAIPAHLHYTVPTPHIAWEELRLTVPTSLTPWVPVAGRRIAGISSFGFSGTNAHLVVEQAPETSTAAPRPHRRHLFVLSAFDEPSLRASASRHAAVLTDNATGSLADVCYTASIGRAHHPQRVAIIASSLSELRESLTAFAKGADVTGVWTCRVTSREPIRVSFLFTGQGSQYVGMGRQLFETEPVFREAIERCASLVDAALGRSLTELLYPATGGASLLDDTANTQPALFALEYALASLWRSWGIEPAAVIGHSVGEYAAACVAGVLRLEDAMRLVAERGRLMQSLPPGGSMAAVFASEADVLPLIAKYAATVSIAAVNGSGQVVISGVSADVETICVMLAGRGVRCQPLAVSHAFHSPLVEPILDTFGRVAGEMRFEAPTLPLISNVTGGLADTRLITQPAYWRNHIRAAVRFGDGMHTVATLRPDVCLEIGPHPTLVAFARDAFDADAPALVASLRRDSQDREQLDDALALLYLAGAPIDWRAVWSQSGARLVDLPPYAFQRQRCWFAFRRSAAARGRETGHPLLGVRLQSALRDIVQFEAEVHAEGLPYLRDHRVRGRLILPAAAVVEMALSAAQRTFDGPRALEDLLIGEPLVVGDDEVRRVQTVIRVSDGGPSSFEILSAAADEEAPLWQTHASGRLVPLGTPPVLSQPPDLSGGTRVTSVAHHAGLAARGLTFGPSLHGVKQIEFWNGEARGSITLPVAADVDTDRYSLPPALLDACLQVLASAIPAGAAPAGAYLPLTIGSVRVHRVPGRSVMSRATIATPARMPADTLTGDVVISDSNGVVAELYEITLRAASDVPSPNAAAAADPYTAADLYTIEWEPIADDAGWSPTPGALAEQVGPIMEALAHEHGLEAYDRSFDALEALSTSWILKALHDLGWTPALADQISVERLATALGIAPRYRRLLARILEILEEHGSLSRRAGALVVTRTLEVRDPSSMAPLILASHPLSAVRIELTERCGARLAEVLRGTVDPLQLLFPEGSAELATSLYRDTPEAIVFNRLISKTVAATADHLPAGRLLRVLEVGGGTGGTTAWVAPALDPARTRYLFTDIGASLVRQARERFGSHPFMEFATFDLEQDPARQSLGGRQFDLILASNVVHATADLRRSLASLYSLLAPGGTLLMLEVAGRERWIDITFGLTEGWWRFTDTALRPDYPLLSRAGWRSVLAAAGFEARDLNPEHPHSREVLLAARKPPAALPAVRGPWLIFADASGVGDALAARLEASGHPVVVFSSGAEPLRRDEAIMEFITSQAIDAAGIVHLWSLDLPPIDGVDVHSLLPAQQTSLGSLLGIVQALGRLSFPEDLAPRLWIGTRGAQALGAAAPLDLVQSPVWGLGQGIAREHPELRPTRIDLDPSAGIEDQAQAIFSLLGRPAEEDQYVARAGSFFVPRLAAYRPQVFSAAKPSGLEYLERSPSGVLEELTLSGRPRAKPGRGQIELQIHAAGLNFRDVMNALAMRDDPDPLGGECSGRVVAVGPDVTEFAVGDDVVAIAEASFATYAVTDAAHVALLPSHTTFAEGATVPFAFMTAMFALRDCAALQSGETILIHAAAGGVGSAAVQLARAAGAVIIGTAGSDAKRAYLRRQGIEHVFDSRSLAFEAEVLRVTEGRGVDVVLNSLAGDAIGASVRCLAERGRFLEIGKRDIWSEERVAEVRPGVRYFAIDLATPRHREPLRSAALLRDVMSELMAGRIRPLPLRAFPLRSAAAAFRFMAQARHIGKIVLVPEEADSAPFDRISPDASYLVTGGLTGIGLLSAEHLIARGARQVVLVGRREPSESAARAIDRMRALGAVVRVMSVDVGEAEAVSRMLDEIDGDMLPLHGIIHSAGSLEDGALLQQSWPRFVGPLRAKVDGAWALHVLTRDCPLDFFIMYSSVASVLGSPGQANHAAANAFMDALAWHRRSMGRPAISISWGAWSGIGAAAARRVDERIGARGVGAIAPRRGLDLLELVTRTDAVHVAAMPVTWERFLEQRHPANGRRFFDRVASNPTVTAAAASAPATAVSAGSLDLDTVRDASSAHRYALLLAFVGDHVTRVIGAPPGGHIAIDQPLNELGLDSLMAVELRNRLSRALHMPRSLPATLVFDHPTLDALTRYLADIIMPERPDATESVPAPVSPRDALGVIDELSDEQIEALFAKRLRAQ